MERHFDHDHTHTLTELLVDLNLHIQQLHWTGATKTSTHCGISALDLLPSFTLHPRLSFFVINASATRLHSESCFGKHHSSSCPQSVAQWNLETHVQIEKAEHNAAGKKKKAFSYILLFINMHWHNAALSGTGYVAVQLCCPAVKAYDMHSKFGALLVRLLVLIRAMNMTWLFDSFIKICCFLSGAGY